MRTVEAHAELERSSPSADAILAAPPENLQFWFSEKVSTDPTPPSITVFDEDGNKLDTTSVTVDPNDARHVTAEVSGFATGTYTVNWTDQSADDGHSLSGTFGFRIGTGRAPGAATVSGENPAPWAVVLRWLTFLGAGTAAAGLIWIAWSAPSSDSDERQKRRGAVAIGARVRGAHRYAARTAPTIAISPQRSDQTIDLRGHCRIAQPLVATAGRTRGCDCRARDPPSSIARRPRGDQSGSSAPSAP